MERRKYPRVELDVPVAFLIYSPDSGTSYAGMFLLKNISQGGIFFKWPMLLPINIGDIREFTIDATPIMRHVSTLKALGKVMRLEPPEEHSTDFGIAVHFLSYLNV